MSETNDNLATEVNTIQTQIDNVNSTISSQQRVISLNDSYSKKVSAYTRLILAFVFALAIAVLLNILKSKFEVIPSLVITLAYMILFSGSVVYAMFVLSDIYSRDKMDFDKLDLDPPDEVSKVIQKVKPVDSNLDLLPGYCIGRDCCTTAMAWDNENNKCLTSCPNAGYYIHDVTRRCTKCAAGNYAASNNTTTTCSACAAGKYSAAGAESCTDCAAGTFSATRAKSCTKCAAGKSSATGASACTDCPAGKSSVAGGLCTDCPAGKSSVAGGLCTATST